MADPTALLQSAYDLIDQANARDPNFAVDPADGRSVPSEWLYGRRMTACQERVYLAASVPLKLACRAQHVRRWEIPRSQFPADRIGYLWWRTTLYSFHADVAADLLKTAGFDEATIARVRPLLKKERIKTDPDGQALEDVICVCFLQHYIDDFAPKHDEAKLINILKKTWAKMSPVGHAAAMELELSSPVKALIGKALGP